MLSLLAPTVLPYLYKNVPFDFISHLTGLHGIKLPDYQAMMAEFTQAVIKDADHLVCDRLVDKSKPILDVLSCDLSHHTLMRYPCINILWQPAIWIVWIVITTTQVMVTFTVTRIISNMNQDLHVNSTSILISYMEDVLCKLRDAKSAHGVLPLGLP